jgi:hypothetical protein
MSDFLNEVRRLEWGEGLWAASIVDHTNTRVDFAGADYAPFDDLINGYTIQFTGAATRVDLLGSNNNLIDVLIVTGVSVVPSNSAGLIVKSVGSGVTAQDITDISNASAQKTWDLAKPANPIPGTWGEHVGKRLLTFLNFLGYK